MDIDAVLLARIQFAFTVAFHIIFPSFTIGLAAFIATLLVRWRLTGEEKFHRLARFWTKIFAVSFAMGVVSGLVLSYQFGTNWAKFSVVVGNVMGPLLGYEVLTAFFLEASFLGIMLFGWQRVSPNLHVTSAVLVAIGTSISAFWILAANSWMHTPTGHEIRDGIAYPVDWWQIIFNPSFPYRFAHMFTAAYLTTSIVVLAVGARYLMQRRFVDEAKTMIRMGLGMVIVLAPLQAIIGHEHGVNTAEYQPMKLAAMEGHWHSDKPADFLIFAWPKSEGDGNAWEIPAPIPGLASFVVTGSFEGTFDGLEKVPASERPPIVPVFYSFRVMVGIGLLLIVIGAIGGYLWLRGALFETRWFLAPTQHIWPLGFIAILAGWWVTESGRQPWIATGILKTSEAVSPVTFEAVLFTLVLFVVVYTAVFSMGIYYINRLIEKGPKGAAELPSMGVPSRPLSAAEDAARDAIRGAP
ncbi:MAG: cytochrome ubiquinol oxidase subunit I [Hyphomicrobium sp.]|nr:cytochrome ubiquinol oxidase subunit I [Hyphomicrobium sp.]